MFLRYLLYALLIYMAYRLIFHFIIPVYKTTKQMRRQFQDIHNKMNEQMNRSNETNGERQHSNPSPSKEQVGDYIDFEEVKKK